MIIESLNIGLPKKERFLNKEILTGISKAPVKEALSLGLSGFEGDGVGDSKNHGGRDKAVCVYSMDHYPYWAEILGFELPVAAFGENISVSGLSEDDICIGDIFRAGTAVLQISQPRQPCSTLSARIGRMDMAKLVVDSGKTGFYFRVLNAGEVKRGDSITLVERDSKKITVSYANLIFHHQKGNREGIEKILSLKALSESWRDSFHKLSENKAD